MDEETCRTITREISGKKMDNTSLYKKKNNNNNSQIQTFIEKMLISVICYEKSGCPAHWKHRCKEHLLNNFPK